jgi:hypothetical protein
VAAVSSIPAEASLAAYVTAETARLPASAVEAAEAENGGSFVTVHSQPVDDDGILVAVAAFSYGPGGHPVQVLAYRQGRWAPVASLPFPDWPPERATLPILPDSVVSEADVTGDGRPDFLVMLEAADNTPGIVVSEDGGGWRYVPFTGAFATSDVVARDPRFVGATVVSTYDDCNPDCASGHNDTMTWSYQRSTGDFWAPAPPGSARPGGTGSSDTGP